MAFGLDGLFTAVRVGSSSWQLQRLDLVSLETWIVDDELRGGHFVDLMLAPSSRYLLEGDFEEQRVVLYELAPGGAHKRAFGGPRSLPIGFVRSPDGDGELALTTADDDRHGLLAWSAATGERVAELPSAAGRLVCAVGSLDSGKAMWVAYDLRRGGRVEVEIVAFPR
jgi:hypothetical protein